jgi:hypothetical protein
MRETLKEIIELESIVEQTIRESPEYKTFYHGFLKGLKEARAILIKAIKLNR